jgi:predicted acetyltransferase
MADPGPLAVRRLRHDEVTTALERSLASFGAHQDPARAERSLRRRVERGQVLAAAERSTDRVLAHASAATLDHWLGGRRVCCQHVTGVAVAPEDRGRGAATALLRAVARTGAQAGAGLSLLFPSVDTLYRQLGWEHAGDYARWRMACRAAAGVDGPPLRRLQPERDWPAVRACHRRFGAANPALAVRDEDRWAQLSEARFGWVRDVAEDRVDAYVLLDHEPKPDDWRHRLAVRDWAAISPEGLTALVALVGRHGTTAADLTLRGAIPHPFQLVLPEQELALDDHVQWMARGLDLSAAVAARGFPMPVCLDAIVEIDDEELGDRGGTWRLTVEGGRGALRPSDERPTARLAATAVGPLLTGHRSGSQLALAGHADGDEPTLAALSAAFSGPRPHLTDFF